MSHAVVLIGLGSIGMAYDLDCPAPKRVCTHARAFDLHRAFGPLAGVDLNPERRRVFEATYGEPSYRSLEEALERLTPNVVVIATPTASHLETLNHVLACTRPKAILCEKPLAQNPWDAQTMVAACENGGVALYVNYMRRSDPGVSAFKNMIERGEIHTPIKGVVWYSKGLANNGSHLVDLMRHWMGPVECTTLMRAGRRWGGDDPEPDFIFEYSHGPISFLAANEECFSHHTVELVARNGRLRYEQGGERMEWQGVIDDPHFAGSKVLANRPDSLPADMARYQLNVVNQLALALEGENAALCPGRAGLETLRDVYRVIELL